MYQTGHRFCVCKKVGEADGEDMVFIHGKRRRRKHLECLKMAEMDALGTGAKERFEEWLAGQRAEQRSERTLAADQASS